MRTPPAWTVAVLVPFTFVGFFLAAALWGVVAPIAFPPLGVDERLLSLWGFIPIELLGVVGPMWLLAKWRKLDLRAVLPFGPVGVGAIASVLLATIGLDLVITYLQAWFAQVTHLPYPREISDLITAHGVGDWLLILVAVAVVPAVAEELVTRGYIQGTLVPRLGLPWGVAITALIFALLHLTPAGLPTYLVLGTWLSLVRHRTQSLWASMLAHSCNNVLAVLQANFVAEAFWPANMTWALPLGLALFSGCAAILLRTRSA